MSEEITTKKCTKCNRIKGLHLFSKDRYAKDGYNYTCRSCCKKKMALRNFEVNTNIKSKVCTTCNKKKSIDEFSKGKIYKDGMRLMCRTCVSKYDKNRRTQNRLKNLNKTSTTNKITKKCAGCGEIKHVKYFNKNVTSEDGLGYSCAGCSSTAVKKSRLKRKHRVPSWFTDNHQKQISKIYNECKKISKDTGIEHHVDHIIPLQGKVVSGLHVPENLQIIPASENLSKNNKFDLELQK